MVVTWIAYFNVNFNLRPAYFASLMVIFCRRWISQGLVSRLADGFPGRSYFNAKYAGRQRFRSVLWKPVLPLCPYWLCRRTANNTAEHCRSFLSSENPPKKNMNHCFPNTDLQLDLLVSKTNGAVPVIVKHRRHYDSAWSVCVLHMACEITGKPIMAALKQLSLSGFLCWVRFLHSVVNGSPYSGAYLVLG